MKSLTVLRNSQIVGNNSKSYNDKHPENPTALGPIRCALRQITGFSAPLRKLVRQIKALSNKSRPEIHATLRPFLR